jgi:hypothetical protein
MKAIQSDHELKQICNVSMPDDLKSQTNLKSLPKTDSRAYLESKTVQPMGGSSGIVTRRVETGLFAGSVSPPAPKASAWRVGLTKRLI